MHRGSGDVPTVQSVKTAWEIFVVKRFVSSKPIDYRILVMEKRDQGYGVSLTRKDIDLMAKKDIAGALRELMLAK